MTNERAGETSSLQAFGPRAPGAPRTGRPGKGSGGEPDALAELARSVAGHLGTVAAAVLVALALGAAWLAVATPSYQSDVLLRVEGEVRGSAGLAALAGAAGGERAEPELEPEMEILRSRSLLSEVVDELGLAVEAAPRRFPVLGRALARRRSAEAPAPPLFGLSRYGWGGERIRVGRLEVGEALLGVPLRLVALEAGRYRLVLSDGSSLAGRVGEAVSGGGVELVVSELVARPGTEFLVQRRRQADAVQALQAALRVSEKAKKSGTIALGLDGPEPRRVAAILDAVAAHYLARSRERSSAEAGQALRVLQSRLPEQKAKVDSAEAALAAFQRGRRIGSPTLEGQAVFAQGADLDKELTVLEQKRAELRQRYTESHPEVAEVGAKLRSVRQRKAELEERKRQLPQAELEVARLSREAKVAGEQYQLLFAEAERLKVARAAAAPRAVVLDAAWVPARPARPRPGAVLVLAGLLGLTAGFAAAFAQRGRGLARPEELERKTGLPVLAELGRSRAQARLSRAARWRRQARLPVLGATQPDDPVVDELWALRAGLEKALVHGPHGILAVLGPGPEVGKSFVCVNLAHVLASSGRKVLLVDADLRRGTLHRHFGAARGPGLSDAVAGAVPWESALVHRDGVDLLPAGTRRAQPAGALAGEAFETLLARLARHYDVVIVDTAPLLAVADALSVARLADANLLVLDAALEPLREAERALRRLERSGVRADGLVLNRVRGPRDPYSRYRAAVGRRLQPGDEASTGAQ